MEAQSTYIFTLASCSLFHLFRAAVILTCFVKSKKTRKIYFIFLKHFSTCFTAVTSKATWHQALKIQSCQFPRKFKLSFLTYFANSAVVANDLILAVFFVSHDFVLHSGHNVMKQIPERIVRSISIIEGPSIPLKIPQHYRRPLNTREGSLALMKVLLRY